MIHDAHVHFFSPRFLDTLGAQKGLPPDGRAEAVAGAIGIEAPASVEALADRWVAELDRHDVGRACLIASVPGDEDSVAAAVARHPSRFVGFFMLDPTAEGALERASRAVDRGMRGLCLFPAMQRYPLHGDAALAVCELAAKRPGTAVFVHCGALSVGVRRKLGLPSPFEIRFGNPLDLQRAAQQFPTVPFILPHFGAGLFREALMLAAQCPNIHFDTSSSNAWMAWMPGLTLERVFETALAQLGPDRLLFGSDSSFFPRGWVRDVYKRQEAALTAAGAGAAARASVFSGTFDRLFPLTAAS